MLNDDRKVFSFSYMRFGFLLFLLGIDLISWWALNETICRKALQVFFLILSALYKSFDWVLPVIMLSLHCLCISMNDSTFLEYLMSLFKFQKFISYLIQLSEFRCPTDFVLEFDFEFVFSLNSDLHSWNQSSWWLS